MYLVDSQMSNPTIDHNVLCNLDHSVHYKIVRLSILGNVLFVTTLLNFDITHSRWLNLYDLQCVDAFHHPQPDRVSHRSDQPSHL